MTVVVNPYDTVHKLALSMAHQFWVSHFPHSLLFQTFIAIWTLSLYFIDLYVCLISDEGTLVVNPYNGSDNQKWKVAGDRIQKFIDSSRVLDIYGNEEDKEARICEYEFHGNDNQLWTFEHLWV